jgi:predicted DNA-binding protein YlxM (UPF0122 family)
MLISVRQQEAILPEYQQQIVLWLDFYSQLLTARTREVLELHYNEDMTLSEIAEHLAISRQGVYDRLHQGVALLQKYETRLGLVQRFLDQKAQIQDAIAALDQGQTAQCRDKLVRLYQSL